MMIATAMYQMSGGEPTLIVGGAGQAGIADHIAHCIDVRQCSAIVVIHLNLAATVGHNAQRLQPHIGRISSATIGP